MNENCRGVSHVRISPDGKMLSYQSMLIPLEENMKETQLIRFVELKDDYLLPKNLNCSSVNEVADGLL